MTTFVFTQALNIFENQRDNLMNTLNSQSFGNVTQYMDNKTTWKKDKISGKLSELSVQTSTYNKIIPIIYGTNKIAGNVIWLDEVQEVVNNNTTTIKISKGQKIKQNNIEYFYFLNFAIAICGNEINSLKNIWADTTLLNFNDYAHRFYNGTEEQESDPLIKSKNQNCTAYKGIAYIVFENFPLSQFNNRLPNFLFEVARKDNSMFSIANSIDGVKLFHPCGNYTHHIEIQCKAKYPYVYDYFMNKNGGEYDLLNKNNNSDCSDALLSLQQLQETLPNNQYYCIPSTFFANNKNIASCTLTPRVEFNYFTDVPSYFVGGEILTRPDAWNVGVSNRFNSTLLGKNEDGSFRYYGGTPSDGGMLSIFKYIKNIGGKTIFCPNIYIDNVEKGEGSDLYGTVNDVTNFFTKTDGYNAFIVHYANLLKNFVDVFLIGNGLTELTSLGDNVVEQLVLLAENVRNILGNGVKISYSANYDEYNRHVLDKLWARDCIDFVGIKAYFPLTYTTQEQITGNVIKNGWNSVGIRHWWESYHLNPDSSQTQWTPCCKKIWFTEFGFCSTDATTNEPYKEYKGNEDEDLPIFSDKNMDVSAQKLAIEATLEYWDDNKDMVERKILNYWDLRPYPYFPNKISIWSDATEWKYNYCINNKINVSTAKNFIKQIFEDAELPLNIIGNINLDESVDGLILNNDMSVRDVLYLLQKVCFFDCVEKFDKIDFISNKANARSDQNITEIYYDELIGKYNEEDSIFIETCVINTDELAKKLSLIFIDKNYDYDSNLVASIKENVECSNEIIDTIPVVLDEIKARNLSEIMLNNMWLERIIFKFSVNLKYLFLEASDLVKLHVRDDVLTLKIKNITIEANKINIIATQFDRSIFKEKNDITLNDRQIIEDFIYNGELNILELPCINNAMLNNIYVFFGVKQNGKHWNGANIYFSNNFGREYKVLQNINKSNIIGDLIVINNNNGRPYYLDKISSFNIFFSENINKDFMRNLNDFELLSGENLILLGDEILQYKSIILQEDGSYKLKELLRGLFGTERYINNHTVGEKFVFLENLPYQEIGYDKKNMTYLYKIVNLNNDVGNVEAINYILSGKNLLPLKPCHFRNFNGILKWNRVDRGNTNWISDVENFCVENVEKYYIEFYSGNNFIKGIYIEAREYELTDELNIENLNIKLRQVNNYGGSDFAVLL
jgi:hypothetical protein